MTQNLLHWRTIIQPPVLVICRRPGGILYSRMTSSLASWHHSHQTAITRTTAPTPATSFYPWLKALMISQSTSPVLVGPRLLKLNGGLESQRPWMLSGRAKTPTTNPFLYFRKTARGAQWKLSPCIRTSKSERFRTGGTI